MNAKDYGILQKRKRVFMASVLDDNANFELPDKCELKKKQIDCLEDGVDENLYSTLKTVACNLHTTDSFF